MKVSVSVVSYTNSLPFAYGIFHSDIIGQLELSLDVPAVCADKLVSGEVDMALIPVIEISRLPYNEIVGDFCIGAEGPVKTVELVSHSPLESIKTIYLDSHSRTSVALARVLAENYWNIKTEWVDTGSGFDFENIPEGAGAVVIGDKNFKLKYPYTVDLADAWIKYTKLPFVFACWVARKKLDRSFLKDFNAALRFGINHLDDAISMNQKLNYPFEFIYEYLTKNISFALDENKMKAMQLFFRLAAEKKIITEPVKPLQWNHQIFEI
jgi:chorismate dehydratase